VGQQFVEYMDLLLVGGYDGDRGEVFWGVMFAEFGDQFSEVFQQQGCFFGVSDAGSFLLFIVAATGGIYEFYGWLAGEKGMVGN